MEHCTQQCLLPGNKDAEVDLLLFLYKSSKVVHVANLYSGPSISTICSLPFDSQDKVEGQIVIIFSFFQNIQKGTRTHQTWESIQSVNQPLIKPKKHCFTLIGTLEQLTIAGKTPSQMEKKQLSLKLLFMKMTHHFGFLVEQHYFDNTFWLRSALCQHPVVSPVTHLSRVWTAHRPGPVWGLALTRNTSPQAIQWKNVNNLQTFAHIYQQNSPQLDSLKPR